MAGKQSAYAGIVVSSCRFRNEVEAIKMMGGKTVRLLRSSVNLEKSLQTGMSNHDTETAQLTIPDSFFDYVMNIPEGLDNYYKEIDLCLIKLKAMPMKVEAI